MPPANCFVNHEEQNCLLRNKTLIERHAYYVYFKEIYQNIMAEESYEFFKAIIIGGSLCFDYYPLFLQALVSTSFSSQ